MFLEKKNKGKNKNQCSILKGYNQDDIYEKSNVERKRDNKKKRCYLWDSIEHFSLQKKKKPYNNIKYIYIRDLEN